SGARSQTIGPSLREAGGRNRSEAGFDALEDDGGEGVDLCADERAGEDDHEKDRHDLGHEGERDFLDLGQRLDERDADADDHRHQHGGRRCDQHRPDRELDEIERIGFVHCYWTVMPFSIGTSVPPSRTATTPPDVSLTDVTTPATEPSAEVMVWPSSAPACATAVPCSSCDSFWLTCTVCSTWENVASWATYWVESIGCVGSWFFSSATSNLRNDW